MALTWQIPDYVYLARQAASALGAANDPTIRAILAQWQCEQPRPAPWPPVHNNPGNLTRAIGSLGGPVPPVATTAPGAGLLYAYATPQAGAAAYARYLVASSRYPAALAAARASNGLGFLTAVCDAGYGTRLSCCASLYAQVALPPAPPALHRYRCALGPMRVRSAPSLSGTILGLVGVGSYATGHPVAGGPYTLGGHSSTTWLELAPGRYTAAAGFVQVG